MSTNQNEKEIAKQLLKLNVRKRKRNVSKTNFALSTCPYIKRKHNVFYVVNKKNKKRNTSSIRQLQERITELKHQLAHLRSGKKLNSCPKCKKAGGICMSRGKKGHLPLISVSEEDMAVIDQKKRRHHTTQNGQTHALKRKQHDFYVVHKKKRKRHHETQNGQTIGTERKSAFQPFKRFMEQRKRRVQVKVLFKNLNLC